MEVIGGIESHASHTRVLAGAMEGGYKLPRGSIDVDFILLCIQQDAIAGSHIHIADLGLSAHQGRARANQANYHYSSKVEFHGTPPTGDMSLAGIPGSDPGTPR